MSSSFIVGGIDWSPIVDRMRVKEGERLPSYPGDLKTALLDRAGLSDRAKGEEAYQLAREIARLTTCCDPEIAYWFSRLVSLIDSQVPDKECQGEECITLSK
ncbi:hypothetical protein [Argonema antarcticum]|uniref:hypothetical protein n=1 Tax=Argonema antarcticum TaxID=2942763 RepID=UPI0020125E0F|nr:hypothetical protein [Argonema antarcticum]MCL1471813.1 hypothetical protein [Argonema antarcticum A004/B2]